MMWRLPLLHTYQTFLSLSLKLVKTFSCFGAKTYSDSRYPSSSHMTGRRYGRFITAIFVLSLFEVLPFLWLPCNEILIHHPVCVALYAATYETMFYTCTVQELHGQNCQCPRWLYLQTKNRNQRVKMLLIFFMSAFSESLQNQLMRKSVCSVTE